MNKTLVLLVLWIILTNSVLAQKMELRPSLGWGYGWGNNYQIVTNDNNSNLHASFDKPIMPNLQLPQLGIMLDVNWDNKFILSVGRMHGKTELVSSITGFQTYSAALIQKWGGEFLYSINNKKKMPHFFIIGGIYYANNRNFDYNAGNSQLIFKDTFGTVNSIIADTSTNIKPFGVIVNAGIRIVFYNKNVRKEKYSITVNFDYGLKDIWTYQISYKYNYFSKYYYTYNTSRGTQLKIYISKPIDIYATYKKICKKK